MKPTWFICLPFLQTTINSVLRKTLWMTEVTNCAEVQWLHLNHCGCLMLWWWTWRVFLHRLPTSCLLPGGDPHQSSSKQTCRLSARPPAVPPSPQPESGHFELYLAEHGSDLQLQRCERLRGSADSGAKQQSAEPPGSAAQRDGFHQTRVPRVRPTHSAWTASDPDQCATGTS